MYLSRRGCGWRGNSGGRGMGSQRQQWVVSREQQTTRACSQAGTIKPTCWSWRYGEGHTWDRGQLDTLRLAPLAVLISDPTEKGRGQWKPSFYSVFQHFHHLLVNNQEWCPGDLYRVLTRVLLSRYLQSAKKENKKKFMSVTETGPLS